MSRLRTRGPARGHLNAMLFSTPLDGPRARVARIMTRTGWASIACSVIVFFALLLLSDLWALPVWSILVFAGLFLLGGCLLFAPMMLLALPATSRQPGHPRCEHCDYDLMGLTSLRCPECGETFNPAPACGSTDDAVP